MKQLDVTLSFIDKLSRPLKQAQSSFVGFAENLKAASMQIGGGVLALVGAGMVIKGALSPAIEMFDAFNDAAAKGIDDSVLNKGAARRGAIQHDLWRQCGGVCEINRGHQHRWFEQRRTAQSHVGN